MKIITKLLLLILISYKGLAQTGDTLRDDLVKDKISVLSKFLPMYNGTYLHKVYVMPVTLIEKQLEGFRNAMTLSNNKQTDSVMKELARKDVDYFAKNSLNYIIGLYGMDSLGQLNLQKVRLMNRTDPRTATLEDEAFKKAFTKSIPRSTRDSIINNIYANPELDNEILYKRSAAYREWLVSYINRLRFAKYLNNSGGYVPASIKNLQIVKAEFPVGLVKDELNFFYTMEILKIVKDSTAKENAYQEFMNTSSNISHKSKVENIYSNFKLMTSKAISPDFEYEDIDGKQVSIQSLRGKYIYIDVWATWCGPCKAEIPYLQKIEDEMHGRNISFVSLSVDRISDKAKWADFVRKNKLGGIQVIADKDFNSEFIKKYNINAIPRFILIDPKGSIISADAYRPSDPRLQAQLTALLAKE